MVMKIIYNDYIPFRGFIAINLFGNVFARNEFKPLPYYVIKHELVHTRQMQKYYYVGFYLLYLYKYIINIFKYKDLKIAYKEIDFEKEAYEA